MGYTPGVADEVDSGVDKQKILAEIGGVSPPPPEPPRRPPPPPRDIPAGALAAMAPPTLPEPAPVVVVRPLKSRWERYRRQIASLVLLFVSLLWFGVGLATEDRAPFAIGGCGLGLAVLIWVGTLVRET